MIAAFKPGRCAFIPYVMAGDPDLETTRLILQALAHGGADVIELGVPYGDPIADGPTIAQAGVRALRAGVRLANVLDLVRELHAQLPPLVLFTYVNPVARLGAARFANEASSAGVAAVIVPDIALEESETLRAVMRSHGLLMPLLVAPSTPPQRAARIAAASSGFVYVVSRLGVTGARTEPDLAPVRAQIEILRRATDLPLAVGFGISTMRHVKAVRAFADGVIVGSAIIDAYGDARGADAARRVSDVIRELQLGR